MLASASPGVSKSGAETNDNAPVDDTVISEASSPDKVYVRVSPSASVASTDPITVTFSVTVYEPPELITGASLLFVTVITRSLASKAEPSPTLTVTLYTLSAPSSAGFS